MPDKSVLVAMSGGVDSSVTACLLQEAGYRCVGVTMKLFSNEGIGLPAGRTCCSLDDVEDARAVAYRLGIPHYVCNFKADFRRQVIDRFIAAYEQGRTPNPCIDCNRYLKFGALYQRARELDLTYIATGHYARIEAENGRFLLKKALDPAKDQSYVLYSMTQAQLSRTLFPLGSLTKAQVREIAEAHGFINAAKPDSQDICFVPDGDYARFIRQQTGKEYPPGPFVDPEGKVIGTHRGIVAYTVGQRRGLGLSSDAPLYVRTICPASNRVVVGHRDTLYSREASVSDVNWIAFDTPPETLRARVRIRYRAPEQWAAVRVTGPDTLRLTFDEPQRAVTPGQAAVLYDGDTVLGGGTIEPEA